MTIRSSAVRALLFGGLAGIGFATTQATAQEISPTTVIDIDQVLAGQGIIEIDLNNDDITDFLVEIVQFEPELAQRRIADVVAATDFPPADFNVEFEGGDGRQLSEVALIRSVDTEGQDGGVLVGGIFDEFLTPFVLEFERGDLVGNNLKFNTTDTALLYFNTAVPAFIANNDGFGPGFIEEESFGTFSEDGQNGFVGLSIFTQATEDENFGFLEITRGSVTVGEQGFQMTAGEGAQIAASTAVPLPAPLAFLAVALLGLFGLRRRA